MNYVLRLNTALSDQSESSLVDVIFMSHAPSSPTVLKGEPESPVSSQSTFPGRENTVRSGRWKPFPDRKV